MSRATKQSQSTTRTLVQAGTCGPCHPDADCIHSSLNQNRPGRVLRDVGGYKNPEIILRIAEKVPCSIPEAEALFEETKQYLARSAVSAKSTSPTKQVDIAWHEFILFTQEYARFCHEHFGYFIHHVPTPRLNRALVAASADCEDCSPLSNCDTGQVGSR